MIHHSHLELALALLLFPASLAPAAVTVYYDRAAFESAIGPHVTYTFDPADGFPPAPADYPTFGQVSAATTDHISRPIPARLRVEPLGSENQTLSGWYRPSVGTIVLTNPLLLSFSPPQHAVGFEMYTAGHAGMIVATFAGPSGPYTELFGLDVGNPNFFGMTSADPLVHLRVSSPDDPRSARWRGLDNLTIVPEPALLSLGASLLSVLLIGPRRRNGGRRNGDAHS